MPLSDSEAASSGVVPRASPVKDIINNFEIKSNVSTQTLKNPPKMKKQKSASFCELPVGSQRETDVSDQTAILLQSQKTMADTLNAIVPLLRNKNNDSNELIKFLKEARERKLSFNGTVDQDAKHFLCQFESLDNLLPLSDLQKLKALKELLTGAAKAWLENHLVDFGSYQQFKQQFFLYFVPCNYDAQLRIKICTRKQLPNESVTKFISEVRLLNFKLEKPFSEIELLDTVKLNLNEHFLIHVHLNEFTSLNDLELFCIKIEKAAQLTAKFSEISAIDKSTVKCYNCKNLGHFAKECPSRRDGSPQEFAELVEAVKTLQSQVKELLERKN